MQSHTFLSTLSLRRATARCQQHRHSQRISIHALLAESDGTGAGNCWPVPHFYPRSPCGERQTRRASRQQPAGISIHALLAESDLFFIGLHLFNSNFYPRSPCGERPAKQTNLPGKIIFLSTLSLRRATHQEWSGSQQPADFYPRSPCGERPSTTITITCTVLFLSTLSLRRATSKI